MTHFSSVFLFYFWVCFTTVNMQMADGILYCLNLNLSMHFRVGSKSRVTTVNKSFLSSPIFVHKELHLRCCIGLELNILTWSTKVLKGIRGNSDELEKIWKTHPPRSPKITFSEVFHIKVLEYIRTCNIFYLINGLCVTFGIFDWHILKKSILSYQTT